MRKKRQWTSIALLIVLFLFLYFFILPDTIELRTLVILPFHKEPVYLNNTRTVDNGCHDVVYGNFCVLSIPSEAEKSNSNLGSVTLCTQGTVEFLHHVAVLCQRWGGPISVAVYSPPLDYPEARTLIETLQGCDFCIRHWVSWHFFGTQKPGERNIFAGMPGSPADVIPRDCRTISRGNSSTAKRKSQGPYPINVGRNLARQRTLTPYVFSLDIELYPSTGVLPKFERMIRTIQNGTSSGDPQVWVLPVFEVHSQFSAPTTKFELRKMFTKRQAISFHKFRCNECHMIPNLTRWLNHEAELKSEVNESFEELKVWMTVKRRRKQGLKDWEPFFIGTKEDPEFDTRLSWEGKQNKMQMAYEMCLRNYNYHIVDNAFLVHAPGINVYSVAKERFKRKYIHENIKWMSVIRKEVMEKYGSHSEC